MSEHFWRLIRFSAPVRLALVSLAFSLLISVPVLLFVYRQTDILFEQRVRSRIDDRQANLAFGYKSGGISGLTRAIDSEIESGADRGAAILLVDSSGRKLAGTLAAWPPTLPPGTNWLEIRLYRERSRQAGLYALRTIYIPGGYRLLLGTNIEDRERMRASLVEALIGALLLAIPLGLIGGWLLLRASARQARAVALVASRIAAGDFSHRLDERAGSEEFALIAAAINAMLERIEELVEQLRLVTDSLAHDLRSPLTRMRANVDRASGDAISEPEQRALEAISTDIDRLLRLISATLEISRAEAGIDRAQFTDFDLAALIRDISEIYQPVVEEQGSTIEIGGDLRVPFVGNRQMIGRAVANLLDNALKYGGEHCRIGVAARDRGETAEIVVSDSGPGIPPELYEAATHKYRRIEEARTTDGSGLGLALVRAIARLHGGDIDLSDNQPGLCVRIALRRGAPVSV